MNKVYKVVWNNILNIWQCVSELASSKGKTKSSKTAVLGKGLIFSAIFSAVPFQNASATVKAVGGVRVEPNLYLYSGSNYNGGSLEFSNINSFDQLGDEVKLQGWSWNRKPIYGIRMSVAAKIGGGEFNTAAQIHFKGNSILTVPSLEVSTYNNNIFTVSGNSSFTTNVASITAAGRGHTSSFKISDNSNFTIKRLSNARVGDFVLTVRGNSTFNLESFGNIRNSSLTFRNNGEQVSNINANYFNTTLDIANTKVKLLNAATMSNGTKTTLSNNANLELTNGLTLTNSVINLNGATLSATATGTLSSTTDTATVDDTTTSPIVLNATSSINTDDGVTLTLDEKAVISGGADAAAELNKKGNGTLIFAANNTYTGNTNVEAGTLQLGNGGETGSVNSQSDITLSQDTTLKINRSNEYRLSNKILAKDGADNTGNLVQAGRGTTIVDNTANNFSGTTSITGGVLQFENLASMGSAQSDISTGTDQTLKGKLKIDFADDATISRNIVGTGEFEKSDVGKLTYTGKGTYTGMTTVSGGELDVTGDGSIVGTSNVLIDNMDTFANNPNVAVLTVHSKLTTANPNNDYGDVEINNGTFNIESGGVATIGNIFSTDVKTTDDDKSRVNVKTGGTLNTNLVNGDVLFKDFNTNEGGLEEILVDGTLNVGVAEGAKATQEQSAGFTGSGDFIKSGKGEFDLTAATNKIGKTVVENGSLGVKNGSTLDSGIVEVGDNIDGKDSAKLNIDGELKATSVTVKSDGHLNVGGDGTDGATGKVSTTNLTVDGGTVDVNKGTVNATDATVNSGTVTIDSAGTVSVGEFNPETGEVTKPKALTLNGGTLDASGTLNAENIVSNAPTDSDTNAIVKVQEGGNLNLTPTGDKPLFDGFNKEEGDSIEVGGTLSVNVKDEGTTVSQNQNAPITALTKDDGSTVKGTLSKDGKGTLELTAETNTLGITNINDGKLAVAENSKLDSTSIQVGDEIDKPGTATLEIAGTVEANTVSVKSDGKLEVGTDAGASGTLTVNDTLTVDGGTVDVNKGTATVTTTNLNSGTVNVDNGAEFKGTTINVGNADGSPNSATFNANGTVSASEALNVKSDGHLNVGGDGTDGATGKVSTTNLTVDGGTVDVNKGTLNATDATVNSGTVNLDQGTKFNVGVVDEQGNLTEPKNLTLNGGTLTANGTLNTRNIVSDAAADNDTNAVIQVGSQGNLNLKPSDGDTLFSGFDASKGDTIAVAGNLNVDVASGGSVTQENTANITALDGQKGTLNKTGEGELKLTAESNTLGTTNIKDGKITVAKGANLDSTNVVVGFNDPDLDNNDSTSPDGLVVEGSVNSENLTVNKGQIDVEKGASVTATGSATVNGGSLNVKGDAESKGSLTVGTKDAPKDLVVNSGTVNLDGKLNAKNITSNTAEDGNSEDAIVKVGENGLLTLTPASGDTLFSGFDTSKDDGIQVGGELAVNVAENVVVKQAATAGITPLTKEDGTKVKGTLSKEGKGSLELTAETNTLGTTKINDGKLAVAENSKLDSTSIQVGDEEDVAGTATLEIAGTVEANTVSVKSDGKLEVGTDAGASGTLTVNDTLTVDGGTVDVNKGTATVTTTNLNSGTVNVDNGAEFKGTTINVGNADGSPNSATFNANGTVSASEALNVKSDGHLNVGGDGTDGATGKVSTTNLTVDGGTVDVNKGTLNATDATVNSGTVNLDQGTKFNVGVVDEQGNLTEPKNLTLNGGTLTANGTLNTRNIVSDAAADNDTNAVIQVGSQGNLNLKPSDGDTLFSGFDASKGDTIAVAGNLNVDVASGGSVTQENTANITALDGQKGTLNKTGEGELKLTAESNTLGTTNIKDGKITVAQGANLDSTNVVVGFNDPDLDNNDSASPDGLVVEGSVNSENLTVNKGQVDVEKGASVTATGSATVNGGSLNVKGDAESKGSLTVGTKDAPKDLVVNSGTVNLDGKLNAKNITSNTAEDGNSEDAIVKVGENGLLTLTPASGDTLFSGFDTSKGDGIQVGGELAVNVAENVAVKQATTAGITPLTKEDGTKVKGTLSKEGKGSLELTAETNTLGTTNIKDGTLSVAPDTTLNSETVNVGDEKDAPNSATFNLNGTLEATDVNVKSDGHLNVGSDDADGAKGATGTLKTTNLTVDGGTVDVNKGTVNATDATVNSGTVTIDSAGTVSVGEFNPETGEVTKPKALTLNGGTLDASGTLNAENIVSNAPTDSDTNAIVKVQEGGNLNLTPTGDKPLFDGFNKEEGDSIEVGGTLSVNVKDEGTTVSQNQNAPITALTKDDGSTVKGTLSKDGKGTLELTAETNTLGTTNIKDGTLSVAPDTTLNSETVNVGDGKDAPNSATFNLNGTLEATDVNVKSDGHLNVGSDDADGATGTLNTTNLTVDGGKVDINKGTVDAAKTKINDGTVTVDKGATLDGGDITVGDGEKPLGSAALNANGTVNADNVTVNKDAAVNIGSDGEEGDSGTLTVKEGGSFDVDGGAVNVNKGTLTSPETNINDGSVTVDKGATLDGGDITVGDGEKPLGSAALNANGTVNADNVTVNKDAAVNIGSDGEEGDSGTLTVKEGGSFDVDGGAVNVNKGTLTSPETNINDGSVTVDNGATLDGGDITVGDGEKPLGSAALNANGTVNADNVTVNKDAAVNIGSDGEEGDSGTLTVKEGGSFDVDGGAVNVNKGTLTSPETNINDGSITVDNGATLDGGDITVGNNDSTNPEDAAKLVANGTVNADNVTVNKDAAVNIGSDGEEGDSGTLTVKEGGSFDVDGGAVNVNKGTLTSPETNINDGSITVDNGATLDGGDITVGDGEKPLGSAALNANGTVNADNVTVNKDAAVNIGSDGEEGDSGTLTVKEGGSFDVDGGAVNVNKGTLTSPETNINDGSVTVDNGATLDSPTLNVGNGEGDTGSAALNANGTVNADDVTVSKDAVVTVGNNGHLDVDNGVVVNGGDIDVGQGGTLTVENGDIALNGGNLDVAGNLTAQNITSTPATEGDTNAIVNIAPSAVTTLKPKDGATLFDGFDISKGDNIGVGGTLNVEVEENTAVRQNPDAAIGADKSGQKGTLNKTGEGEFSLTAANTLANTNVKDGTLTVEEGATLNSDHITVGDTSVDKASDDSTNPDTLNIKGTVNAQDVTVNDGRIAVTPDNAGENNGKLNVEDNIIIDGGELAVGENGEVRADNIKTTDPIGEDNKASKVTVDANGILNLTPADGENLFEGFNTNPAKQGKDGITINGTLNFDTPAGGTVSQNPDSGIAGSGVINKNGDGTFVAKADNPFAGITNVNAGTLQMAEGGKLGNSQVNVKNGATIAVDRQGTALGGLDLSDGGTLSVIATPEGYSQIDVKNNVNLNGGKLFTDITGSREEDFKDGELRNVIHAGGSIDGELASYDDNSDLFNFIPVLSSDKTALHLRPKSAAGDDPNDEGQITTIAKLSDLKNAIGVANALDTIFKRDPAGEISRLFYTTSKDEVAGILPGFLPAFSAATSRILGQTSRQLAGLPGYITQCDYHRLDSERKVWGKGYGSWSNQKGYTGAPGYHTDSYGVAVGAEICHREQRLGIMLGYANDRVHSYGLLSDQKLRAETVQVGVYGSKSLREDTELDFKAGLGYSEVDTERKVTFTGLRAEANYDNKLAYAGLTARYHAYHSDKMTLSPYAQADYQLVHNDSYAEKGAKAFNLHVNAGNNHSLIAKLGLESKMRATEKLSIHTDFGVGYDVLGRKPSTVAAFEAARDTTFTTKAIGVGLLSGQAGLKLKYKVTPSAELSAGYEATISKGYFQHSPSLSLKVTF